MNLEKAQTAIKHGAYAGFLVAGTTTLLVTLAMLSGAEGEFALWNDPWNLADIALVLVLSVGFWRKSRFAAVLLSVYFVTSQILIRLELERVAGLLVSIGILYFMIKGAVGTFVYHQLRREQDPEYRPAKRWMVFVAVPAGLLALVILALIVIGSVGPSTAVITGDDLPLIDRELLQNEGVLEPDEIVILFYSAGFLSITEDGNILTDRRVISYETTEGSLWIAAATFDEVAEVEWEQEGDLFSDSVVSVAKTDGEVFMLLLSVEDGGDKRFMRELQERVSGATPDAIQAHEPGNPARRVPYLATWPAVLDGSAVLRDCKIITGHVEAPLSIMVAWTLIRYRRSTRLSRQH